MPELPDVEAFKRYLDRRGLHRTIKGVRLGNRKILKGISITNLTKAVIGETIERSWRHGKLLFAALDKGKWLTLHFGMTGSLAYFKDLDDDPRHDRLRLDLDNEHHLAFVDQRMFGRVGLTSDPETYVAEAGLGADALAISKSEKAFADLFGGRRGQVKDALMDQSVVAGIGNIYSDEILFQARLHPRVRIERLDSETIAMLCRVTRKVLETAIRCDPTTGSFIECLPKNFLSPHRRPGDRCPGCNGTVATLKAAGRTSYYCLACQDHRD
jgi:formamidopyrimidine-DNA glycosylase